MRKPELAAAIADKADLTNLPDAPFACLKQNDGLSDKF